MENSEFSSGFFTEISRAEIMEGKGAGETQILYSSVVYILQVTRSDGSTRLCPSARL
jgi:hypothetical protein